MMLLATLAGPANADDGQLWATMVAQGPIAGQGIVRPIASFEVQQRVTEGLSRPSLTLARVALGARLAPDVTVLAAYHFQHSDPVAGIATDEHRLWQQLAFPLYRDPERLTIGVRLRIEQRWIAGADDTGWRARAWLRIQRVQARLGNAVPLLWSEALLPINDTDWGQRRRVRQFRHFIGAAVPIDNRLGIEAGYMLRTDALPDGTRKAHVANILLNYRFGD